MPIVAVLLGSCTQQPQRQPKMSDAQLRQMHSDMPGMTDECLQKIKWGGIEAFPSKAEECFTFTAPTRIHGLWRNQFEGSEFCEATARQCPDSKVGVDPASFVWFQLQPLAGYEDTPPGGLYEVDFIGRHSLAGGRFGHFGMSKNEVVVDRLLSIRLVEPPPSGEMTKEHIESYLKDCAGKAICMPNSEVPRSR